EENLVQPQPGIEEEVLAEYRIPLALQQVEHVFFIARGVDDGDRRVVQQPVRLAVALARVEAGESVVLINLPGEVSESRRDIRLVEPGLRGLPGYFLVHAPIAERSEESQLVLDQWSARGDVDVRHEIGRVAVLTEAVLLKIRIVIVARLQRVTGPR